MIKYDVKNYEEFFSCIAICKPIYMEKYVESIPIPELQGFIYPFFKDGIIQIATAVIEENRHISADVFRRMIVGCNITGDTMVKVYNLNDSLFIYKLFKDKYNLFVLDHTYDIEKNN